MNSTKNSATAPFVTANWATGFEKIIELGNANVEAFMAAGKIATKNFEAITQEMMVTAKSRLDKSNDASRAILACKDPQALVDLQQEQVRSFFENSVSDSTKLSDLSMKAATEAVAPLADRFNATVETMLKPQV